MFLIPLIFAGTPIIENLHIGDETLTEVYKTPLVLDEDTLNTLTIPEIQHEKSEVTKNNKNLLAEHRTRTRRVRLKSISLDSDQARLVEENIGVPVEELVGGPGSGVEGSSQMCGGGESKLTRSNTGRARKINKFNLTINVVDQSEGGGGGGGNVSSSRTYNAFTGGAIGKSEAVPVPPQTPKTPIQKAASLDSEPTFLPPPLHHSHGQSVPSSSISVPSTPKRQPFATPKLKYAQKMYTTANKSYGCLRQPSMDGASASSSNNNLYFYSKCNRKLRSYDENISSLSNVNAEKADGKMMEGMDDNDRSLTNSSGNLMIKSGGPMCSLQVTKFNTLNVSNTNLKTLPESEKLNDFSNPAGA